MWRLIMGKAHELPAIGAVQFSFLVRAKGAHWRQLGYLHFGRALSVRYRTQPLAVCMSKNGVQQSSR
jgi:hypothetical protein